MSIPSNLYAEKVFSEHPIALWPLDDQVDYVSLISEEQRDFSDSNTWQISGGTASLEYLFNAPFNDSYTTEFNTTGNDVVLSSPSLITKYLSPRLKTISVGFYAYEEVDLAVQDKIVESFKISLFSDPDGQPHYSNTLESSITINSKSPNRWHFYSHTFTLPNEEIIQLDAVSEVVVEEPTNFELANHGLSNNDRVLLTIDNGKLPGRFEEDTIYFVQVVDNNNFNLSLSFNGTPIASNSDAVNIPSIVLVKDFDVEITAIMNRETDAKFYLNGLSVGQWSEQFQEESLGIDLGSKPNIGLDLPYYAIPSNSYGLSDSLAYYLANNNELLAKNINMPMVFGSRNLTSLVGDDLGAPSIVFPGNGLLNENGKYRTYTVEFWLRLRSNTFTPRRIFGPISSDDGLYVDGPFLIVKIGDNIKSHYVGDMYRPILLNFLVFENGASLVINGEKVLDMNYQTASLSLPSNLSLEGFEQDWLGFYSYQDIDKFEIDCFAIYPYRVPTSVSKRRYVYGQAIDFPENITSAFNGKSFPVDYTFAQYSNNYVYPDIGQWRRGNLENISIDKNVLSPPKYSLPEIVFDNKSSDSWYASLTRNYSNNIVLRPDSSWNNTNGYIYFDSFNLGERDTKAFYGVFEARVNFSGTETLFVLENASNKNYIKAEIITVEKTGNSDGTATVTSNNHGFQNDDIIEFFGSLPAEILANKEYFVKNATSDTFEISEDKEGNSIIISNDELNIKANFISYKMKYGSSAEILVYQTPAINLGTTFVAGIDIDKFANTFGGKVSTLVKNKSLLRVYFGGNREFTNTFSGYIYRIGFATKRNLSKLSYLFSSNGIPFLRYQFDGGSAAADTDTPIVDAGQAYQIFIDDILSHNASYTLFVKSDFGRLSLDIATDSSWQDYLPLQYFAKTITRDDGSKVYGLNFLQFNIDYPEPIRFNGDFYDSERSWVRTYISFQYIEDGANKLNSEFTSTQSLTKERVVKPGSSWQTTKYEVVDNTVIYLPPNVDFEKLAIVLYADIQVDGIISRPVRIKKLEVSSKALDAIATNKIHSRLGSYVSPYVSYGYYQDADGYNPFSIYKDNTPHLYLTKNSGLRLQGTFPSDNERGILMRINRERKQDYDLSALQTSMYFDNLDFLEEDLTICIFEGRLANYFIKIKSIDPDNRRVRLYAADAAGNEITTVGFYINGRPTYSPAITVNEWNMIGFAFVNPIDMNRRPGAFKVVGPVLFNNISYYALTTLQEAQRVPGQPLFTDYSQEDYIGVDLSRLYNIYTGTNKIIAGDDITFTASQYQYSVYKDLSLQTITTKAV